MAVTIPVMTGYAILVGTDNHGVGLFAAFLVGAGMSNSHNLPLIVALAY